MPATAERPIRDRHTRPTRASRSGTPVSGTRERAGESLAPAALSPEALTPAGVERLQRAAGNRAVQHLLSQNARPPDPEPSQMIRAEPIAAIQRDLSDERYVPYTIEARSRAPVEAFRAALETAIPPDRRSGDALRMLQVLPAVAAILDEFLSAQFTRAEILDGSSPCHPGSYGALGLGPDDANALWDLYKARWESQNAATRRQWLSLGQRRISALILPYATTRHVPQAQRAQVRQYIDRLIRQRIAALRSDRTYAVLSRGGQPLAEPIIITPPVRGAGRPRGPRETPLTAEQTGELYQVDDPGAPVTAEEIEQARSEIQVQEVSRRDVEFINTDILAPMPVPQGDDPGIRREAFANLVEMLREQERLEADIAARTPAATGETSTAGEPPAESPEVAGLRQRLTALHTRITAESAHATELALAWYRQQEAAIGAGVAPAEPQAPAGRRIPRASTRSGSPAVRLYYIRRAIAALEAGTLLRRIVRTHYRGTVAGAQIDVRPAELGIKVDRPEGHGGGGPGYREGLLEERVRQSGLPPEHHAMTLHVLQAFSRLEGAPQSLNTWDSAVLTLGSGLAARGVLQTTLGEFKQADPRAFRALFGRYGIDVEGGGQNWNLTLRVPQQPLSSEYTAGELLRGERAITYIVSDPVLLVQLRRAGHAGPWQIPLIDGAIGSVRAALAYQYRGVGWTSLMQGLPAPLVEGTYFALANNVHASGNTSGVTGNLDTAWAAIDRETELEFGQLTSDPAGLAFRQRLAVAAALAPARNRRNAFIRVVPALAAHLPAAPARRRAAGSSR
ncbi:MAG: hypothetical protein ACYCYF_01140 [Anaerolineae bacterium]